MKGLFLAFSFAYRILAFIDNFFANLELIDNEAFVRSKPELGITPVLSSLAMENRKFLVSHPPVTARKLVV